MNSNHTTLKDFKAKCAPSVRILAYKSLYTECTWQCRLCKKIRTYKTAAEVYRRQLPCMCQERTEFQALCPDDVEILEYTGRTKPCTFRCLRCEEVYVKKALHLYDTRGGIRTNCLCSGQTVSEKLSTTLEDFLASIKHLPYVPLNYKRSAAKCDFECLTCGYIFEAQPSVLAKGKHVCPDCKHYAFADQYRKGLAEEFPHIRLVGKYTGMKTSMLHKCNCGHQWMAKPLLSSKKILKVGCPICDYCAGGPKLKEVSFGERRVRVQGYEDIALIYLLSCGINPKHLAVRKVEGVPNIKYRYKQLDRVYYPDFYHLTKNRIVEVKSIFTLLSVDFKKTCAKAKACISQGYEFRLLLINKTKNSDTVLRVPKNWYELTRSDLVDYLVTQYPDLTVRLTNLSKTNPFLDSKRK